MQMSEQIQLWREFKELLEEARHFLIHPTPDRTRFKECMKLILERRGRHNRPRIAEGIIRYFLDAWGLRTSKMVNS